MIDLKKLVVSDDQPYYRFVHNNEEYFIYAWLEDDKSDVYKMCLAVPELKASGEYNLHNVLADSATKYYTDKVGGTKQYMNSVFLPKVNEYLDKTTGGTSPVSTFPEDLDNIVQFNWLVESGIEYRSGKVHLL